MPGFSADIELVRPAFTPGDTPGVEAPRLGVPGTVTVGSLLQYEQSPLVLYRYGDEDGTVIEGRAALTVGASLDFSKHFGARLTIPLAYDVPGNQPDYEGTAFGAGDMGIGLRAHIWHWGPLDLGAHADLLVPVGTTAAWKGEGMVRGLPGLLVAAGVGPLSVRSDTAFMLRPAVETGADFTLGSELVENVALVADVWTDHLAIHATVNSRVGLATLTAGGAENVAELLVGAQVQPARDWTVDLGVGRGLTEGYGTTRYRVFAGLTWSRSPRPPKPAPVVARYELPADSVPDELIIEQIAKPKKVEWRATELARVEQDQIVIRDPIQFEFAKDVILPISAPTLSFMGKLLEKHPEIVHLVIEGHASEEGSFYYNYDLAKKRADAIWRALIEAGVSPTRISTRSMGEVEPRNEAMDEASLAENRRVIFHIVKRLAPGEQPPGYKLEIKKPWTGEPATLPAPPPLPPPPVPLGPDGKPIPATAVPEPGALPDEQIFDDEEAP